MSENIENKNQLEEKKQKEPKTFSVKKLPGIFRKSYTEKAFNKKIIKKLYVESDKELIKSLFTEKKLVGKKKIEKISIKKDLVFQKKDLVQLKELAKEIRKNKGRVKFVPLIAVAGFITALVLVVMTFKNPIAKKLIKAGCESVFGAKTDIKSVNVELLGISIKVNGIAIGNKNSENYMKNLFEAEKITVDMNFTQALRGKVIINDVSVTGMKFNTDRKTSCYIPISKTDKDEKSLKDSAFMKSVASRSNQAIDELKNQATMTLGGSNADEIVANIQSKLQTPIVAKKVQEDVQNLVTKWQQKPTELKSKIDDFSTNVKEFQELDLEVLKSNPMKLKEYLEKINSTIKKGNELKTDFESVAKEVKTDADSTKTMATDVANAVKADKKLAEDMVGNISNSVKDSKKIFTHALDAVGYDMLGKYYPYAQQGINYALEMKRTSNAESKNEKPKEEKKTATRLKGTTFWYSKELPSLWIKNVSASGYTENDGSKGFSGAIKNITSDQNLINKPTTIEAMFDVKEINHSGNIILDVRKSASDLIAINYVGKGFEAKIDGNKIAKASGIPSIDGKATLTLKGSGGEIGFSAGGKVELNPLILTTDGFANETVTKYYKQALDSIKNLSIGYDVSYSEEAGVDLTLNGNFADQFMNALKTVIASIGKDAKELAFKKLNEQINSYDNEVTAKIKNFLGIEGDINEQNANLDTVRKALEAKKSEIEKQINGKIDEAKEKAKVEVEAKKKEAEDKAKAEIEAKKKDAENKAKEEIGNKLKGLKLF